MNIVRPLAILAAASTAFAGTKETAPAPQQQKSSLASLWDAPKSYHNESNPILQEFSINGRLQLQYSTGTSNAGSYESENRPDERVWDDAIDVRRWRIGFKSR